MEQTILAISGKPGLYKLISRGKGNLIVESLDEIVKGHSCQLLAMIAESFGQARVEIDSREQQPIVFGGLSQHIMVPVLHNGSLRELVIGVGEQAHG